MKIWQLSTKANNYVKDRLFWRPSFLWHSVSVCVCVCPAGSYIMKKKPQTLLRQTRTIFHNLFFFHADFGGRSTSDCVFQCLEKNKVGGGWWGGGVEAVIWFSHTLKGPLFVSCASEIGWWVLLESGRGETICIHLLYLNGTEEEPREKVELRT